MALVLEAGKWYITEGDYLVYLTKDDNDCIYASLETSPGNSMSGRSVKDVYDCKHGWYYEADGTIQGLTPEWCKTLKIIAEYPKQLSLPEEYEWLGGYPKLYHAKDVIGQYIIRDDGTVMSNNTFTSFFKSETSGIKRIGLVKKETVSVPEYTVSPKPELELAIGKWYLTAGNYLVFLKEEFQDDYHSGLCASIETSPGVNIHGNSITQSNLKHGRTHHIGWVYLAYNNGEITGLSPEWCEKLRIVKEYTYPVVLPDGFEWKGGYPKLYTAEELGDCHFLRWDAKKALLYTDFSDFPDDGFGAKRIGLVKKEATPMPNIQLTVGKWYVTAGDYLVNITGEKNGYFVSSLETSPGVDIYGKFAKDIVPKGDGWYYKSNCEVFSNLDEKWVNDLKIVAEYPHPINVSDRFEWKGGFPKLYVAKDILHDWCILADGDVVENNSRSPFDDVAVIGIKRIGLVKKKKEEIVPVSTPKLKLVVGKWYVTKGEYLVNITDENGGCFIASFETSPGTIYGFSVEDTYPVNNGWYYKNDGKLSSKIDKEWANALEIVAEYPYPIILPNGYAWKDGFPKLHEANELAPEEYYLQLSGKIALNREPKMSFVESPLIDRKRVGLVKVDKPVESPVPVPIVESKEEEMKKETAIKIASVAGSLGFRALNYWFFEPAVNTFRPVVKGVRYAVFLGMITSSIYGYRHPEVVKNAIMSCLPKISVEAPEILK